MRRSAAQVMGRPIPRNWSQLGTVRPEKVRVHIAPRVLTLIWGRTTAAMTVRSTILIDRALLERPGERLATLIAHELIHVRQWQEKGVLLFLLTYIRQYLLARVRGASHDVAYRAIGMEVEAREGAQAYLRSLDD